VPFRPTGEQIARPGKIARDMGRTASDDRRCEATRQRQDAGGMRRHHAIENAIQVAVLAPTESSRRNIILVQAPARRTRYVTILMTGSRPRREKMQCGSSPRPASRTRGGPHALREPIGFHRLGLAIVDEQHRFGVDKGRR